MVSDMELSGTPKPCQYAALESRMSDVRISPPKLVMKWYGWKAAKSVNHLSSMSPIHWCLFEMPQDVPSTWAGGSRSAQPSFNWDKVSNDDGPKSSPGTPSPLFMCPPNMCSSTLKLLASQWASLQCHELSHGKQKLPVKWPHNSSAASCMPALSTLKAMHPFDKARMLPHVYTTN